MLRIVARSQPARSMLFLAPLLAVAITLLLGLAFFAALGHDPWVAFQAFFVEPVNSINGVSQLLLNASPLCLMGLALAIGFRANVWNIGAEGQMYLGGIFAA